MSFNQLGNRILKNFLKVGLYNLKEKNDYENYFYYKVKVRNVLLKVL